MGEYGDHMGVVRVGGEGVERVTCGCVSGERVGLGLGLGCEGDVCVCGWLGLGLRLRLG